MDDTSLAIKKEINKRMMRLTGVERLWMGSRMFDASRRFVLSSFPKGLNPIQIREQLFLRFYQTEFSETDRKKIIAHLAKK